MDQRPFPQPGVLQARCRCGRLVLRDDNARTLSHEFPECQLFKDLVAKAGGPKSTKVEIE